MIKVFKKPPMIYTRDMEWAKMVVRQPGLIYVLPEDALLVDMDEAHEPRRVCRCLPRHMIGHHDVIEVHSPCGGELEKIEFVSSDTAERLETELLEKVSEKYDDFYDKNKRYPTCAEFETLLANVEQRV